MDTSSTQSTSEQALAESAIDLMTQNGACVHPVHYHSFRIVNFMFSVMGRTTCEGCQKPLGSLVLFGGSVTKSDDGAVLQCVACGVYAHRTCGLSRDGALWKQERCPVNLNLIQESSSQTATTTEQSQSNDQPAASTESLFSLSSLTSRIRTSIYGAETDHSVEQHGSNDGDDDDSESWRWSTTGPPQHWAAS